jgi:hypothetical protein
MSMRRLFLLSFVDASSLRSSFQREATYRPASSASLVMIGIIAVAEAVCLFRSADFENISRSCAKGLDVGKVSEGKPCQPNGNLRGDDGEAPTAADRAT